MDEKTYYYTSGATSFAELREAQEAQDAAYKAQDLTWQFQDLLSNIMLSDIEDKSAAIQSLTGEFLGLLDDLPQTKSLWEKVKELFTKARSESQESDDEDKARGEGQGQGNEPQGDGGAEKCVCPACGAEIPHEKGEPCNEESCPECGAPMTGKEVAHPFTIWKKEEGYRWLAIYSNKFRDQDNPPEIIAEAAHKEFVDAVDSGEWPMPEVWLWHVPGTKFGAADFVAYDDSGFAVATGPVDKDKEHFADALMQKSNLLTSHGMPIREIQRDTEDPTIITRYRSKEISPLPQWAAANKHGTGYRILSKEVDMALPEKKRPFLEEVMGTGEVADLERQLEDKAKELEDQDIEFKEETPAAEQEKETEEAQDEPKESEVVEEPQFVTHDDLADVFGGHVKPLVEQIGILLAQVQELGKELKEQRELVGELQKSDEAKIKQQIIETPAASLFDRIGSAIGAQETEVDGRSALAKSKPKEASASDDGPTFVPYLNEMVAQQRGG